jgi:uncharacterized membrane protein YhaH (DUF805 family)
MFVLIHVIVMIILSMIENAFGLTSDGNGILTGNYSLAVSLPALGVTSRRLHDTNRSGWWLLIGAIPVIGAIVLLVFLATDSQAGANQYGPSVKKENKKSFRAS